MTAYDNKDCLAENSIKGRLLSPSVGCGAWVLRACVQRLDTVVPVNGTCNPTIRMIQMRDDVDYLS